jgi:hypothetical protein
MAKFSLQNVLIIITEEGLGVFAGFRHLLP